MMKQIVLALLCTGATAAYAQDSYIYGDLITGEEVRVTEETLKNQIVDRLFDQERISTYASILQIVGDGISCDMMVTWLYLEQAREASEALSLTEAAQRAQNTCFQVALAAQ